jgi:alpha-L-fucosidase
MIRGYQPDIIINDRLQIDQDVKTPEQYQPREWLKVNGQPVVWEAC